MPKKYGPTYRTNPAHVYVIWPSPRDLNFEYPDEFGGLTHRFDYQVERDSEFMRIIMRSKKVDAYVDYSGTPDHIRLHMKSEDDWHNWLSRHHLHLASQYVVDSQTGEVYAEETTRFLVEWLSRELDQYREGNIDPKDFGSSIQEAINMLNEMRLG